VHGRRAAAGVAGVLDVVVDQREGMEQFDRRGGCQDGLAVLTAGATPAPVAEHRPQALAAAGQQVVPYQVQHRSEWLEAGAVQLGDLAVQEVCQNAVHSVRHLDGTG